MEKMRTSPFEGKPLLDIASYARRGPGAGPSLTPEQLDHIRRTVNRVPEVMVKVTPRGANGIPGVRSHLNYLSRDGKLEIETDDGQLLHDKGFERQLIEDWDLDLETFRSRTELSARNVRKPPRLIHKIVFSMPPGTPSDQVFGAVRNFAREQFGLKHRYVMVLHTDEPHPHVHVVVKAMSEDGVRLNIRKATLREWRQAFATHLRELGIAANATERAVRGQGRGTKADPIYRAALRGESTHTLERTEAAASQLEKGRVAVEPGKERLLKTRLDVESGWRRVIEQLTRQGQHELAIRTAHFLERMKPPQTEKELLTQELAQHMTGSRGQELTR